jgi:F-type H+-transporting ATPase subunit alpha
LPVEDQVIQVYAATHGYLDRITVDKVEEFLEGLTQRMHSEQQEIRAKLAGGEWDDEIEAQVDKVVKEFADDFGFDLDEEGHPLEEPETGDEARLRHEAEASAGGDGAAPEGSGEGAPEEEPAAV